MKIFLVCSLVLSMLVLGGCSNCHDYTDDYAVVESDSTFIAFAEPFKTDTSIYPKEDMLSYYGFSNGEALTAVVYYDYIKLFVDIFGCRTRYCKEASSVVIHNSDYSYTMIGYSVNDTIVNFDRIRENTALFGSANYERTINSSLNQCFSRTVITSLTTLFVCVVLAVMGGSSIRDFGLVQCFGILIGTYSSVCVCSPIVLWWSKKFKKGV